MKKVYVVLYHSEWDSCEATSLVLGVYSNVDDARKCMKEEIQECLDTNWDADEEDTEKVVTDDKMTLFDGVGCVDYVSIEVVEQEVK